MVLILSLKEYQVETYSLNSIKLKPRKDINQNTNIAPACIAGFTVWLIIIANKPSTNINTNDNSK